MGPWGHFPFNKDLKNMMNNFGTSDVETYINNVLEKYLPPMMGDSPNEQSEMNPNAPITNDDLDTTIFESFDFVYVHIVLTGKSFDDMKIFHTSNQVIIDIHSKKKEINLPCLVHKKGAVAQIRDNKLEIKLLKKQDFQYSEIMVSEVK